MPGEKRQIVAFGGGGFSMESGNPLMDDYVLSLTGKQRPKVCFLPSASGDADHYVVRFYREFAGARAEASHISLFRRGRSAVDLREHLLAQDLIYVGGGSLVSLIGVWRAHGLDEILCEAWERGIVLCGLSAGALCWFTDALSAYNGPPQRVEGIGLLPWSFTAHWDAEPERREEFERQLAAGMRPGYAADDGAALHFVGLSLHAVVGSKRGVTGHSLRLSESGVAAERIDAEFLGSGLRESAPELAVV
ncbi:MAG: Type 1 glutamine amidotransferase-like domain-containing protein [Solirubrobacterales bacterium]